MVRTGDPARAIAELAQSLGADSPVKAVFAHEESYDEERIMARAVASALPCTLDVAVCGQPVSMARSLRAWCGVLCCAPPRPRHVTGC